MSIISLLIFAPIISAPLVYLEGRYSEKVAKLHTLVISAVTLVVSIAAYSAYQPAKAGFQMMEQLEWASAFGLEYSLGLDGINLPLVLVSTFLTFLAAAGSLELIKTRVGEYYALLLVFEGAIIGVFTTLNLVLFYVFWELVLIPMFFLIGVWGGPNRKYAAMKFLIFTHVGSTVMLLGFIALYVWSSPHTFSLLALAQSPLPLILQLPVAVAIFFGFAVKLPVVPFHTWLPDAHVEAPAPVSVLLAGLLLKMGGYGFIRFNLSLLPEASRYLAGIYMTLGLLTMFYGAVVAMVQEDLKRMIALTSINHMGYVLLGTFALNQSGISGAVFQMFNHASAIGILFLMSGFIHKHMGSRSISNLSGLPSVMPRTTVLLMLGSLGAMGLPGFGSFVSEYMVILAAMSINWLYAVAVLVPAITSGYFMWMMRRVVMVSKPASQQVSEAPLYVTVTLASFLLPLIIFGIYPSPILNVIMASVNQLHVPH